tara:strand:- start:297 stop:851 length:555 start_codon:yes stop_codon:yes gene_type:complete
MPHIVDWPGRLKEMADFVGLGDEDLAVIKETSSVVLDNADDLTAAVYDNFLKFPESRKFFLNENGEVDDVRLDRRKHSLARWLRGSVDFKIDEDYPIRVLATGIVHSHPPVHRAHLGSIPSRFMIGTMSFTQTALADLLHGEIKDHGLAARASAAWNKLMMLQLDILLAGYLTETPTEPAAGEG